MIEKWFDQEVHIHVEGSFMLCFCGTEIYCADLIVLITDHLSRWHQKLYMVEYESNFITYCIFHNESWGLTQQIQVIISQRTPEI
jgi:hypothetical protein